MEFVEEQAPVTEGIASDRGNTFAYRHGTHPDAGEIATTMPFFRQQFETRSPDHAMAARAARSQPGRSSGLRIAIVHEWLDTYG
jgi:hypothetical protein